MRNTPNEWPSPVKEQTKPRYFVAFLFCTYICGRIFLCILFIIYFRARHVVYIPGVFSQTNTHTHDINIQYT